ncbi:MAG TPA: hypothetical protein VMF89_04365, partial [Polyangiales bacterium]|nr:hypothetical protein [Polyangiales bacterium]
MSRSPSPEDASLLDPVLVRHLVLTFFLHAHPNFNGVHPASFLRDLRQSTIYPPLLYSVLCFAARWSNYPAV